MIVEKTEPNYKNINRAGKWHFKIIGISDSLNDKRNAYLRVTCITSDDRMFTFPIYTNDNGMDLVQKLARAIGDVCLTEDDTIDTAKFIGGFFYGILSEYTGDNEDYESGYYVKDILSSSRRYDITGSSTFKSVRLGNRGYSTYKS